MKVINIFIYAIWCPPRLIDSIRLDSVHWSRREGRGKRGKGGRGKRGKEEREEGGCPGLDSTRLNSPLAGREEEGLRGSGVRKGVL